jgi:hypothetical protein
MIHPLEGHSAREVPRASMVEYSEVDYVLPRLFVSLVLLDIVFEADIRLLIQTSPWLQRGDSGRERLSSTSAPSSLLPPGARGARGGGCGMRCY